MHIRARVIGDRATLEEKLGRREYFLDCRRSYRECFRYLGRDECGADGLWRKDVDLGSFL